jgi:hypothetical protein
MGLINNIKSVFGKKEEGVEYQEVPNSFEIDNKEQEPEVEIVNSSKSFETYKYDINFDSTANNVAQQIKEYREIAKYPEVDEAIQEIVNEAIVMDGTDVVDLMIDSEEVKDNLKETIREEFKDIVSMMKLNQQGDELFRQWYEDGRLYLHGKLNLNKPKDGIQEIKKLAPFNLKQIKEDGKLYFIYDDGKSAKAMKIPSEHITFIHSTLTDPDKKYYISHLHKAIKPYNQLKMLEDAAVIYRITRAPERRVFYIDVGQMNKSKAESYVAGLVNKFKNKITYDANSGKVTQSNNSMSMTEDFWLPSSGDGGKGTKVDVLPAGQNLNQLDDIQYFNKKLKKSLNVPFSRFSSDERSVLDFGSRSTELERDEVRFAKFINKLRFHFAAGLFDLLKKQLVFKGILDIEDWYKYKDYFSLQWNSDSYFSELKENEILKARLETVDSMRDHIGKYYSHDYVMRNILKMTEEEIEEEKKKIKEEKNDEIYKQEDDGGW